jgi:hypothetical protein
MGKWKSISVKTLVSLVLVAVFNSCFFARKISSDNSIEKMTMLELAIDHHNRTIKNENKLFYIFTDLDNDANSHISVIQFFPLYGVNANFELYEEDSIGKVPDTNIPNRFKDMGERLYVWNDTISPLSQELISTLAKYNALDSTRVKIHLGLLPENHPPTVFSRGTNDQGLYYFICKKDPTKFKTRTTKWILPKGKYPKNVCN